MSTADQQNADLAIPDEPLPVSILTGFLGSGKTTLLANLLRHPDMAETAVIVNEFGDIGLDHLLVEHINEETVLLNSGCLCCTIRNDLLGGLRRLFRQRVQREIPPFNRLVIETTGLADPAPVLHTLMSDGYLAGRYRLDGVITVVDGAAGAETLNHQPESIKQAAVADRIIISKTDLPEASDTTALEARLRALNPAAKIFRVSHGEIEPAKLFDAGLYNPKTKTLDVQRWLQAEAYNDPEGQGHDHHSHDHDHGHDVNRHGDSIRAFCLTYDRPLVWDRLASWVEMLITLYGERLLRIKGILNVTESDAPIVIHGVQHIFHPPVQLDAWPSQDHRSHMVFITRDLDPEMFSHTLKSFNEESENPLPFTGPS